MLSWLWRLQTTAESKQEGGTSVTPQLKVMVLDASPTTRKILEVILRREGYQVACFDDPVEALRFLSRHGPADLLFLGMDLPKMDGFDVLKYLRGEPRFHSMVPIALLSAPHRIPARANARLAAPPPSGSHGPTPDSSSTSHRGLPSRKHPARAARGCSGRSGSGGKKRWRFRASHNRSWRTGASFPAHVRSWSACEVSAPTRRARCWPSCTGEPSRSSM